MEKVLTYELLHKYQQEQERLIAEGKMERPQRIIRPFTPEEQLEFDGGVTIDDIFARIEAKHNIKL